MTLTNPMSFIVDATFPAISNVVATPAAITATAARKVMRFMWTPEGGRSVKERSFDTPGCSDGFLDSGISPAASP